MNRRIYVVLGVIIMVGVISLLFLRQRSSLKSMRQSFTEAFVKLERENSALKLELADIQNELKQHEDTLEEVSHDRESLDGQVKGLSFKLAKVRKMLGNIQDTRESLKEENSRLNKEVAKLKENLRLWEGKIENLDEKKLVLARRARSIKELRERIKEITTRARRKRDEIGLALGNRGFVIKDGKSTYVQANVVELEKIIVTH